MTSLTEWRSRVAALEEDLDSLPGAELVRIGVQDWCRGAITVESILLCIGRPRLRVVGLHLPGSSLVEAPEARLYELLGAQRQDEALSLYNSLIGRLISFEAAIEAAWGRQKRRRLEWRKQ